MTSKALRLVIAVCFLAATLEINSAVAQTDPKSLVAIETGDLPIILSAPHGGLEPIPGVPERRGEGVKKFKNRIDANTDQLAEKLADQLENKLGKRPYIVTARFHRKYVDANRRERDAYESGKAKEVYDAYHQGLADAREEIMKRWGFGLLIDIHGQSANKQAIFRGTQNGKTTSHLIGRFGQKSLIGETSLFGQMATQGFTVIPAVNSDDREHEDYDGGFIVNTYGSRTDGTVDAIQLELGRDLRSSDALDATAEKLSDAIIAFANEYLPKSEQKTEEVAPK